ncbi:MAG: K(+)-insensitive pyrophosphate-energized proton pump [Candidatus Woesebacteria bacterium GW2011_GWC1_42_9]|nr:MAG: K(+)-insensitive pyrophosphate-energized proton pump [Candidatus Woesebacteria bacterium GW2011_GWC1_42_9]
MIDTNLFLGIILASSLVGIAISIYLARQVLSAKTGNEATNEVGDAIRSGANAYLKRQFLTIVPIVLILAIFLYATADNQALAVGRSGAFLLGSFFSALIGTVGMNIATRANVRVAQAAEQLLSIGITASTQLKY